MSTMDYVPAKVLVKQTSSTYGPLNLDVSSSYTLAVVPRRPDHIDYSMTKGGLRSWFCVLIFVLLVSTFSSIMSGEKEDEAEEDTAPSSAPEITIGGREEVTPINLDLEPHDLHDEDHVTDQEIDEEEQLLTRLRLKAIEMAKKAQNKSRKISPAADEEVIPKITKKKRKSGKKTDDTHEQAEKETPTDQIDDVESPESIGSRGRESGHGLGDRDLHEEIKEKKRKHKFPGEKDQPETQSLERQNAETNITKSISVKVRRTKGRMATEEATSWLATEKTALTRGIDVLRKSGAARNKIVRFFRTKATDVLNQVGKIKPKIELKYRRSKGKAELELAEKHTTDTKIKIKYHRTKGTAPHLLDSTANVKYATSKPQHIGFCEADLEAPCAVSEKIPFASEISKTSKSDEIPAKKSNIFKTSQFEEKPTVKVVKFFKTKGKLPQTDKLYSEIKPQKVSYLVAKPHEKEGLEKIHQNQHVNFKLDIEMKHMLDKAHRLFNQGKFDEANFEYSRLLEKYPESPKIHYGKAIVLDRLADLKKSNKLLEESIKEYEMVLSLSSTPDDLYRSVAARLIDRLQFRGWIKRALNIQEKRMEKFPKDISNQVDYGLSFLILGNIQEAKKVFSSVLKRQPRNGYASVLYGYILKTSENRLEESVMFLKNGIESEANETQDVRFYFHLGDALQRLDRPEEAYEIYEKGAEKGLFLSKYQRSMHNVAGLRAKSWWTILETGYERCLKLIEKEWKTIRDEAMVLVKENGRTFHVDDENLAESDDLIHYLLFSKGQKMVAHCALAPKTCALLDQCSASTTCQRCRAGFFFMRAGTRWGPHCGPTNCRLRAVLTLTGGAPARLRVADEQKLLKRGKFSIFDDSFEHEMRVDGEKAGGAGGGHQFWLALQVDFWHPDLTQAQKSALTSI